MTVNQNVEPKRSYTDIRFIIAAAIGLIGIYLLICSQTIGHDPVELAKTGGINANLYAGIGLTALAAIMGIWWLIKPNS